MSTTKKPLKLFDHEERLLQEIYLSFRIPIDQYESRPKQLQELTVVWNARSGRTDIATDLVHFMKTRRKRGKWVRFDGKHLATPDLEPEDEMSAVEIEVLVAIYQDHVTAAQHGSDVLAYDEDLAKVLAREFAVQTNRVVAAHSLIAKLTKLRKRGLLPKVADNQIPSGDEFADIDDVSITVKPTLPI
jgi:hypothetical protein